MCPAPPRLAPCARFCWLALVGCLVGWTVGGVTYAGESPAEYARAFARLENHYFLNRGFLEADGQILRDLHRLKDVPATIVQGRYDMICPPVSAWMLAQHWKRSELRMIPAAGHALSEPGISTELIRVMDGLRA